MKISRFIKRFLKPATVHFMFTSPSYYSGNRHELSETDLRIIKCLLSNPRMELNDMLKKYPYHQELLTDV